MALVLHLGGVGKCARLIWKWSVHDQESGGIYKWWWLKRCTTQNKPEDAVHEMRLTSCCFSFYILIFYFLLCELGGKGQLWSICQWLPPSVQHDNSHKKCIDMHPLTLLCTGDFALLRSSVAVGSNADMLSDTLHPPGRVFTSSWEGTPPLIKGNQQWW